MRKIFLAVDEDLGLSYVVHLLLLPGEEFEEKHRKILKEFRERKQFFGKQKEFFAQVFGASSCVINKFPLVAFTADVETTPIRDE